MAFFIFPTTILVIYSLSLHDALPISRIVQPELADCLAQILELAGINREQAAKHHRLCRIEAGEWGRRRLLLVGDGIAHARVGHLPDRSCEKADLSRAEPVAHFLFGAEDAD